MGTRYLRLLNAAQYRVGSYTYDSSASETKDNRDLSRGRGCQMPCFLSELAPLACSQPLVKCLGSWYVEGGREKS